jgi:hypothetical protein
LRQQGVYLLKAVLDYNKNQAVPKHPHSENDLGVQGDYFGPVLDL